ncbi:hypothetical protein [Paenibacillus albidus]|nr:hypothetical protein [Paenibacillus albidus]
MEILRNSWFIVKSDFRGDKLRLLWTFLFSILMMGYLAGITGMVVNEAVGQHERTIVADYLLLTMIPMLGFTFSVRTMKYWSSNSYTKMLAYLRALPIPAPVILCKRKIQALISFGLNGTLFFGLMYAISGSLRNELTGSSYFAFALTWVGYGLMLTGVYIFIEYLFSGIAYLWLTMLIMVVFFGITMVIHLAGANVLLYSISSSKEWGLLSPLMWGTLLLGTLSVQLFSKWTIYRLKSRDLV